MRKILAALGLVLTMTLVSAPVMAAVPDSAAAAPSSDFDALLRGAEEVPPVTTQAMGFARFKLQPNGVFLNYELEVNYIRNPIAAHIHCGPRGVNGPVLVFLYGPYAPGAPAVSGVFATGVFDTRGLMCGDVPLLRALSDGMAYVNVHTDDGRAPANVGPGDHPGGEIRGQVFRTPQ